MFEISDKVVCIDDKFEDYVIARTSEIPRQGQVYVVRGIYLCRITQQLGVYLVGINCTFNPYQVCEYAFWAWRFRKLSEHKEITHALQLFRGSIDRLSISKENYNDFLKTL